MVGFIYLECLHLTGGDRTALQSINHVFRSNTAIEETEDTQRMAIGNGYLAKAPETLGPVSRETNICAWCTVNSDSGLAFSGA